MKRPSLPIALLLAVVLAGTASAQSSSDRKTPSNPSRSSSSSSGEKKGGGLLNRLFESRQTLSPEVQARATQAVSDLSANPEAREALEKAAAALLQSTSGETVTDAAAAASGAADAAGVAVPSVSSDLISRGAKLLEQNLSAAGNGGPVDLDKLIPKVVAAAPAVGAMVPGATARQITGAAAREVAQRPAPTRSTSLPAPAPVRMLPDGAVVPVPTDPLPNRIPRPQMDATTSPTRITAETSTFDANTNVVTFEGNVELDHPDFDMTCDILVAELNEAGGEAEAEEAGGATARAAAGGIRSATASGYVVIEKLTPEGSQVAKSRKTVYDAATGIVTLSDFPVLDDGKNLVRGKEAWTKIHLSPDGRYKVDGPATYELVTPDNQLTPGRR